LAETCGSAACFFLHADHGYQSIPGLPCALSLVEGDASQSSGAICAARIRAHVRAV